MLIQWKLDRLRSRKFDIWCLPHQQCTSSCRLVEEWSGISVPLGVLHIVCFSGCCTPKCWISGLLKVATNCFQEKGEEWVHLTGTDFPHFMVLKMCQGSDESSGRKMLLISKVWIVQTKMKWNVVFAFLQLKLLETISAWSGKCRMSSSGVSTGILSGGSASVQAQLYIDFHRQFVGWLKDSTVAAKGHIHFPVCHLGCGGGNIWRGCQKF